MTERWSRREIGLRAGFSSEVMDTVDRQLAHIGESSAEYLRCGELLDQAQEKVRRSHDPSRTRERLSLLSRIL